MGAREKLNQAYLNGAVVLGAVIGLVGQSWTLFWLAAAYVIGSNIYAGGIRPKPGRERHRRP